MVCLSLAITSASISPASRAQQPAPQAGPFVRENATVKVSEHVYVIPDFDTPGVPNVGIIVGNRALQMRSGDLKRQGKSADETAQTLQTEMQAKFPGMPAPNRVGAAARVAYAKAQ